MGDEEISLDEDITIEEPKPAAPITPGTKQVVDYFSKDAEQRFPGPEDVEKLAETPLAWTEICEPMLKELYWLTEKRKEYAENEKNLKKDFQSMVGLERGMVQRGAFGVKVVDTNGKKKVDYVKALAEIKLYVEAQISKAGAAEVAAILKKHTTTGEGGISLTPYVVGKPPADDEDDG